jgi:DNA topoisomerase-6 subunit A
MMAARRKKKAAKRKAAPKKKAARRKAPKRAAARKKKAAKRAAPKRRPAKKRAAKRKPAKKKAAKRKPARRGRHWSPGESASAKQTVSALESEARRIHKEVMKGKRPEIRTPQRSLSNVTLHKTKGYFEIGRKRLVRTLSVNTVRTFAQTLKFMALSKDMIGIDDLASKREVYYQSINWGQARFKDQSESDGVMDDVEAMFSVHGVSREQLRFIPEEHGGAVSGHLTVIDRDPESGEDVVIDCRSLGSGSYTVPSIVEGLRFETDAKFVLAVETGGMYQRLTHHRWWRRTRSVIVNLGGVPSRATRRFLRRLADEHGLPVYVFTDCDPYGFANIYRTLKVGSGNAAHINRFYCVPSARLLGVTPQDIIDYKLPTHPLKEVDVKRAKAALANDPFFRSHPEWSKAVQQQVKMGVRAEQQAFAKFHLNFVMETYLPDKLKHPARMLP